MTPRDRLPPADPTAHPIAAGADVLPQGREKIATLEGLRALAVGLVILAHTTPFHAPGPAPFQWWAPGAGGVRLFFVLSGFLITGILLRARQRTTERGGVLRSFYARRALRILPLASLALIVGLLLALPGVRDTWPWYAGFAINIRTALLGDFEPTLGHLWSLAVEEQFYLLWPWIVLWTPRAALGRTLGLMIGGALAARLVLLLAGQPLAAYVLMPSRLDALAAGALLAYWVQAGRRPSRWCWVGAIASVAIGAAMPRGAWARSAMEAGMVLFSLMVVDGLRDLTRGPLYRLMTNPVAVYLGGISYGLYVWHAMLDPMIEAIEQASGWTLFLPAWPGGRRLVYTGTLSVIVSSLSWYLIEKPLNDLKRFFPYVRRRAAAR